MYEPAPFPYSCKYGLRVCLVIPVEFPKECILSYLIKNVQYCCIILYIISF